MTSRIQARINVVADAAGFEGLKPEWDGLLERSGATSPFLTHEWQWSWWKALGDTRQLFIVTARDQGGQLVGLAPLMIERTWGLRIVKFIGTGLSDYPGIILANGDSAVLDGMLRVLLAHRRQWDLAELQLPDDGAVSLGEIQRAAARYRLPVHHRVYEVAPFLPITEAWEDFVKGSPRKFRYALREREKRFFAEPGVAVRRLDSVDITRALTATLWGVERHSWKVAAGTSPLRRPAVREFYAEFLSHFARRGWVQVWLAALNETPIAYVLNILYRGRVFLYNISYNRQYASLAPGLLLLQRAIRDAFDQKAVEYDFLRGDELYKNRWATSKRKVFQIVLHRWSPASFLSYLLVYRCRWWMARSARLKALKLWFVGAKACLASDGEDGR